jgi:hypothetical protein
MRVSAIWLFALLVLAATHAQACRPQIVEPLDYMSPGDRTFSAIFIGEIVAVRNANRLQELRQCHPRRAVLATGDDDTHEAPRCVVALSDAYEVEVYPTEVLRGKPKFPHVSTASDCLSQPPRLGAEALVFVTREGGTVVRVSKADDAEYDSSYDEAYIQKLEACLEGACAPGVGNDEEK